MSADAANAQTAGADRKIVLAVVVSMAGALFCQASYNYVIRPIVEGLGADETQSALLRQAPGIGGLLAIFVAGVLVMWFGPRRCLVGAGVLTLVGYLIALLAPSMPFLTSGLVLAYVGKSAVVVIVLSLLSSRIEGKAARASAFATLAMVSPAVAMLLPPVASYLVDNVGWRAVAALWLLGGILVIAAAVFLVPPDGESTGKRGELWTPVLAGVVLVGLTQLVRLVPTEGLASISSLAVLGLTVAASLALLILMRRLSNPSLSFQVLRHGGFLIFLVVILLMPFSNMWFYGTIGAQYIYGLSAFTVAMIFVPIQLAGVVGARLGGVLVKARGLTFTGTAMLLGVAAMSFLCVVQSTTIPIIVPVIILMIYGACANAAQGTVTNSVMSMAPPGGEGDAAAFRSAASSLGSSLGALFLSAIVFTTISTSIADQSNAAGISPQEADRIAESMREGATSEEVSSQYSVPLDTVDQLEGYQRQGAVEGYWAQGVGSGIVLTLAAVIFYVGRRRVERHEARSPVPTAT